MTHLPAALKNSRCILHIDLDCFYCQVEQVRLGIPFDVPAAVQQWQGLIAVNYAARNAGIARHSTPTEAKKLCPDIKLLHVATYGPNDAEPRYYDNPSRSTHKVSLDPYRDASHRIFQIFHKYCDTIQKIGSDEGFMDVTKTVNQRLMERYVERMPELLDKSDSAECGVDIEWDKLGVVIESKQEEMRRLNPDPGAAEEVQSQNGTHWDVTTWRDLQLAMGAELAAEIRKEIYDTLNYTCSAGIAHYKVVAKLCSSRNKPNKQTVLREAARLDFMRDVPFKKIRNLGGKLGNEVGEDLDIQNANELWKYSVEDLQDRFGNSTGLYLYNICRGIDHEEVTASKAPKSLMAAKAFTPPIYRSADLQCWFSILSVELHARIMRNFKEYGTWPKTISIKYATRNHPSYRSKAIGTLHKDEMETHDTLAKRFQHFFSAIEDAYPCIGLDLVATGLLHDESSKSHTINRFFTRSATSAHDANGIVINSNNNNVLDEKETQKKTKNMLFFAKQVSPSNTPTPATVSNSSPSTSISYMSFPEQQDQEMKEEEDTEQEDAAKTWSCDKCNKTILLSEVDEHTDYHFALEISQQDRIPPSSANTSSSSSSSSAKKRKLNNTKNNRDKKDDKKQKFSMFFQPRS